MSYVALYRKFRPRTFARVMGQDHVVRTLSNQIKNDRIGHAYLFAGTRGTGKTSVAKIFARAVNCENRDGSEPCNCCDNCKAALAGSFIDIVEIDAASNTGVDDIRRIIEEIQYTPVRGKYKVYIIDEAHMLSGSAFNAFLKTLEEPPAYVVFILATTEPHKLPVTILSRCQRFDFKRIGSKTIADNLKYLTSQEDTQAEDKALEYIAALADGSMRDAISLLDKCIAFNMGEKLTYANVLATLGAADVESFSSLYRAVLNADAAMAVGIIDAAVQAGRDLSRFITDFIWYIRNLLMIKVGDGLDVPGVSPEDTEVLKKDSESAESDTLIRYIRILSALLNEMKFSQTKQILAEVAVIKLAKPQTEADYESLADRIRQLEERSESGPVSVVPEIAAVQTEEEPKPQKNEINADCAAQPEKIKPEPGKTSVSPADIICSNWIDILDGLDDISLRFSLRRYTPVRVSDSAVSIDVPRGSIQEKLLHMADIREKLTAAAYESAGSEVEIIIKSQE